MQTPFNATSPGSRAAKARQAVLLSAFVFPGLGQASQRRWAAAVAYGGGFTAAFCAFLWLAGSIIASLYRFALNFDTQPAPVVNWRPMAVAFALAMLIYLANVIDAWRASRRR